MVHSFSRLAAACIAAAFLAGAASATTLSVTTQGSQVFKDAKGGNAWYESVSYKLNGVARSALAGLFRLKATTATGVVTNFVGFCLEPLETLRLPKDYDVGTPLSQLAIGRLGALVANALPKVSDARSAAAFQLAAWEIANESNGVLNLGSGAFRVTQASNSTESLASRWLDNLTKGKWQLTTQVTILQAPGTQDLVTDLPPPSPVPVPAAGLMLAAALAGVGAVARRRS